MSDSNDAMVALTADIVAAYVAHNRLPVTDLGDLIQKVHSTIAQLGKPASVQENAIGSVKEPAVPVRKSITPDYLICLDDGKQFKAIRRHLSTLGMTPDQYRAKWGLPGDYPMVAPNYAARRSELAKKLGLGQRRKGPKVVAG